MLSAGRMPAFLRKQIFKTQLSIVGLHVVRAVDSGDVQSFAHCIEMKTNNSRRETHRGNATLLRQATNSRFAHLKKLSKLLGSHEFLAIGHFCRPLPLGEGWGGGLITGRPLNISSSRREAQP